MKKIIVFSLVPIIFFSIAQYRFLRIFAVECGQEIPTASEELKNYINSCNSKISESKGQQATLSAAIAYFTQQINLTQAQINQTTQELERLNLEITDLSGKIESIDYSLVDLTKLFVNRVRASYIQQKTYPVCSILSTSDFPNLLSNLEYLTKVRDHDQAVMLALEQSRLAYDEQKTAKEEKQQEVETLQNKLASQRSALNKQQLEKANLLAITKNDEKVYASLLADAQAQLAAFNKFVSNQGGASILSGTTRADPGWGTYYNQRDSQWGNRMLGNSTISVADAGCLITSMSMIMTYHGKSVNPGDIAGNSSFFSSYFPYADFLQGNLTIQGVATTRTRIGYNQATLDSELAAGKPVILGVSPYGSSKPEHFIVVKEKAGSDYLINDPFIENGININFLSHYSLASIRTVDRVSVN